MLILLLIKLRLIGNRKPELRFFFFQIVFCFLALVSQMVEFVGWDWAGTEFSALSLFAIWIRNRFLKKVFLICAVVISVNQYEVSINLTIIFICNWKIKYKSINGNLHLKLNMIVDSIETCLVKATETSSRDDFLTLKPLCFHPKFRIHCNGW